MRFSSAAAALAAIPYAAAHYTFSGLTINGQMVGRDWQYVREHTRGYMPTFQQEAATSNDFRCQPGSSGAKTEVYTVKAGDKVGLRQAFGAGGMEHPGPAQVYVSKAPGSVKDYVGDGDWVKMSQSIICKPNPTPEDLRKDAWCSWGTNVISFTVPESMPAGEYLVRAEHIALHGAHDGKAEFYYACAQIKVEGTTGTELQGEKVKIPGVYKVGDKPFNFSVWGRSNTYPQIPGPPVAPGGTVTGSTDGSSAATVVVKGDGSATPTKPETPSAQPSSASVTQPSSQPPQQPTQPEPEPVQPSPPSTQPSPPVGQPGQPGTPAPEPVPQPTPGVPAPQPGLPSPPVVSPVDPVAPAPGTPEQPPCPGYPGRGRKGRKGRKGSGKKKVQYKRGAMPRVFRA